MHSKTFVGLSAHQSYLSHVGRNDAGQWQSFRKTSQHPVLNCARKRAGVCNGEESLKMLHFRGFQPLHNAIAGTLQQSPHITLSPLHRRTW